MIFDTKSLAKDNWLLGFFGLELRFLFYFCFDGQKVWNRNIYL